MSYNSRSKCKSFFCIFIVITVLYAISLSVEAIPNISVPDQINVGLYYGDTALPSANLLNYIGTGYQFGYYDEKMKFTSVAETDISGITIMKNQNIYFSNNVYSDTIPTSTYSTIGRFHILLHDTFFSYIDARKVADTITMTMPTAFPLYKEGRYYVCVGNYASDNAANEAIRTLGINGEIYTGGSTCISIAETKTSTIIFEFELQNTCLVVRPKCTASGKAETWFKNNKYYGDFQYSCFKGNNIAVINTLSLEDYVKGVVPYEMSAGWPIEALKAQSLCVRTYAIRCLKRHNGDGFNVCNSEHCQVYRGTKYANEVTNAAVEETQGKVILYKGNLAETFYYSSNGGGSEGVWNVWSGKQNEYGYLNGIIDSYELSIADSIPGYNWVYTFSGENLSQILRKHNVDCQSAISEMVVSEYSNTGNAVEIKLTDEVGEHYYISKDNIRTWFGLKSLHFSISNGHSINPIYVSGSNEPVRNYSSLYVIDSSGKATPLKTEPIYAISSIGIQAVSTGKTDESTVMFVLTGTGRGHSVGMSQWGAYAMANEGFSYMDILNFYYQGIDVV